MDDLLAGFLEPGWGHSCVLLISPEIRALERAADELVRREGWPRLSLGRELAAALLSEAPRERPRAAARWLAARLAEMAPGPVVCSEIDLLCEPSLSLDALALLRAASRGTRLVVMWPGSFVDNVLAYAVPGHEHYRTWRRPEVDIRLL